MQFFTRKWWASGSQDAKAVFAQYSAHFARIREGLPRDLVELEEQHTLHDSEVKEIACDFNARTVTMKLEGWTRSLDAKASYVLHFGEARTFEQVLPQEEYVEEELGDLGYWECDVVQDELRVNMLFVSGAEFRVVFKSFELEALRR